MRSLARAEVLALQADAVAARREADVVAAKVAAEIARRSSADDGLAGLARREGFGSPQKLVAAATGGSEAEARRLIAVGEVLDASSAGANALGVDAEKSARGDDDSSPLAAAGVRFPTLAAAVDAGRLSVEAAAVIRETLGHVVLNDLERDVVAKAERRLVAVAISVTSLDPELSGKLEPRAASPASACCWSASGIRPWKPPLLSALSRART